MQFSKFLTMTTLLLICGSLCGNAMAKDTIDPEDFVDEASAAGVAEINTSNLALQKSASSDIKKFAQEMINDHTAANKELAAFAQKKSLKVATEAELTNKAKAFMLKQKDGESFDEAYISNQVSAHKDTIKLFNKAVESKDVELAEFAKKTLPKLEHHLHSAQELAKVHDKNRETKTNTGSYGPGTYGTGTSGTGTSGTGTSGTNK